jgi:membrane protein
MSFDTASPLPLPHDWPAFLRYGAMRFWRDECPAKAAALAFDLLFAMTPTIAIGFAILSAFPILDTVRLGLQDYITHSFLPQHGQEITALFDLFIQKTRALTGFSVAVLAVSALLLFNTVDTVFNRIWRQTAARPLVARLFSFWAIMTGVPLLIAGSVALSTVVTRRIDAWGLNVPWLTAAVVWIAPFLLLTVAFAFGYRWLPYRRVRFVHALVGGVVAAALFEALRWIFSLYVAAFPNFWILYGALASVPIALLWIYFFWCVVLFGAEVSAALPEWQNRMGFDIDRTAPAARRLAAALLVMEKLLQARIQGAAVPTSALAKVAVQALATADLGIVQALLDGLARHSIIAASEQGWRLARDPAEVALSDLADSLALGFGTAEGLDFLDKPWREILAASLRQAQAAERDSLSLPVESLLAPRDAPARRPS